MCIIIWSGLDLQCPLPALDWCMYHDNPATRPDCLSLPVLHKRGAIWAHISDHPGCATLEPHPSSRTCRKWPAYTWTPRPRCQLRP